MGLFSVDENSTFVSIESKLNMIKKIIEDYDFLSDTRKNCINKKHFKR